MTGLPGYGNIIYSPIPVTVPPPESPITLSPVGDVEQPVPLSWIDPGAGTPRAAEYFSLSFMQDGRLCEPTSMNSIIVAGNVAGSERSYVASGIAGGPVQWRVSASNPGGNSGVAAANIRVLTAPAIRVTRSSGNTFEVTGVNFSSDGGVLLNIHTDLDGGTQAIQKTLAADSAGGWNTSVDCAGVCSSAGGGG